MKARLNFDHYLLTVRFDVWMELLFRCRFRIAPKAVPQAILVTLVSLLLFPAALLEALVMWIPVRRARIRKPPVFIIGNWRTGTTFLQNLMTRDPQFGWLDPISALGVNYCTLLGTWLEPSIRRGLKNGRPMDNMEYALDLPMENEFAMAAMSPLSIIHAIALPLEHRRFMESVFVDDLTPREQRRWRRQYDYLLRKMSLLNHGRQLILKSPDDTCHIRLLREMYPDARFIYLSRDPYRVIMSTLHMFRVEIETLSLQTPPADLEDRMADIFLTLYERMCRDAHAAKAEMPENRFMMLRYSHLTHEPEQALREIYETLELDGFEEALPVMRRYLQTQRNYRKNRFTLDPALQQKINARLGYVFAHDGYEMEEI